MKASPQRKPQRDCTKVSACHTHFFSTLGLKATVYTGVRKGEFHITDTFIADVFRASTRGSTPFGSNVLKDLLYGLIGSVRLRAPS